VTEDDDDSPKVTVVTGALGAGKTTLVNRWLSRFARGDVAVIVNELGDVGVDGELLAERAREVIELTGGCVCCTTQADLVRALLALSERAPRPRRVFVETSGAASPAGVVRTFTRGPVSRRMRLDGVVVVVDATRPARVQQSLLAAEQVAYADVVVLSRADECSDASLAEAEAIVTARNPAALVARAVLGEVTESAGGDLDALLARRGDDLAAPRIIARADAAPAHDLGIEAVSLTHDGALDEERFTTWVESEVSRLGGRLMRVKGVLALEGLPVRVVLQGVTDRVEVTLGAPWEETTPRSRMVLIGYGLAGEGLAEGFAKCAAG
jgi:G3E family GTPase